MIIYLLLLSQARCEWVEVSQNHYRKDPTHIVHLPNIEYTTKSNRMYVNNTITEKQWHKAVIDRVSNVGNIRRVQHLSVKTSSVVPRHEDNRFQKNFYDHPDTMQAEYNYVSVKPYNIQKFANEDDDLDNLNIVTEQTISSTSADIDRIKNQDFKSIKKIPTLTNAFERRKIFDEKVQDDVNQRKEVQIRKPLTPNNDKVIEDLDFNENEKMYPIRKPNFHKVPLEDELKSGLAEKIEKRYNTSHKFSKIKLIQRGGHDYLKYDVNEKQSSANEEYSEASNYKFHETSTHALEEYFNDRSKVVNNNRDKSDYDVKKSKETAVDGADDKLAEFNRMENAPSLDDEEKLPKIEDFVSTNINVTKRNSMKGMWKLIKLVTDTIYKNTHRSFKSKINYLETLKATILASIEDQIERAWPDDAQQRGFRRARSAQAQVQSRGHVEFPSSESTLMTISFLTFAVFVIKLVLQVIHTYKNKTMMVTPTIVAAVGRAAAAIRNKAQNSYT